MAPVIPSIFSRWFQKALPIASTFLFGRRRRAFRSLYEFLYGCLNAHGQTGALVAVPGGQHVVLQQKFQINAKGAVGQPVSLFIGTIRRPDASTSSSSFFGCFIGSSRCCCCCQGKGSVPLQLQVVRQAGFGYKLVAVALKVQQYNLTERVHVDGFGRFFLFCAGCRCGCRCGGRGRCRGRRGQGVPSGHGTGSPCQRRGRSLQRRATASHCG